MDLDDQHDVADCYDECPAEHVRLTQRLPVCWCSGRIAEPTDKPRVERAGGHSRASFFAGRTFPSLTVTSRTSRSGPGTCLC